MREPVMRSVSCVSGLLTNLRVYLPTSTFSRHPNNPGCSFRPTRRPSPSTTNPPSFGPRRVSSAARVCWQGRRSREIKSGYRNRNSGWETFNRESFDLLRGAQDKRSVQDVGKKMATGCFSALATLLNGSPKMARRRPYLHAVLAHHYINR